ncbi:hypothetical protein VCHA42O253_20273 [Vibrio chagasii]|nr:hypothetical protein VCHA42O253_20273 [Vibrio chagasii]
MTEAQAQKRGMNSGVAVGGAGGITGVIIGFINIRFSGNEFLPIATTMIPLIVGGAFWAIEYLRAYKGIRSKAEMELDAQLKRKIAHLDTCIADALKNINEGKAAGIDTSEDEKDLKQFKEQKRKVRIAHINAQDVTIKPV